MASWGTLAQCSWIVLAVTSSLSLAAIPADLLVETNYGSLQGFELHESFAFWGIPYAQPPVGDLRLGEPRPPLPWTDVRNATEHSGGCMQRCQQPPPACPTTWSEDCLYLDLWVPKTGRSDYPTFIFMHGGAFRDGSGGALLYDGRNLAIESDSIIITINYRLEVFGFAFLGNVYDPATGKQENIVNLGLKDQQMAMKWAKENIHLFGGDPDKITIGGQSAGAQSVGVHLLMESSRDLFDQALMFSNPYTLPLKTIDDGLKLATAVASLIGCDDVFDLVCWRNATADAVLNASKDATRASFNNDELLQVFEHWGPGVGPPSEIPEEQVEAYQNGLTQRKPTMLGTTREEGRLYIFLLFQNKLSALQYRLFLRAMFGDISRDLLDIYPADLTPDADQREILSELTTDFIFHCSSVNVSRALADQYYPNYYHYIFDAAFSFAEQWTPDLAMCYNHVCHGGDLVYYFRTATIAGQVYTPEEQIMMDHLTAYLSNFFHTGNPNIPGTEAQKQKHAQLAGKRPFWPRLTEKPNNYYSMYYSLCRDNLVVTNYRQKYCQLFDELGYYEVPRLNSVEESDRFFDGKTASKHPKRAAQCSCP